MKSSKISALILCMAMALTASAGCSKDSSKSSKKENSSSGSEEYKNPGNDEEATKNVPQSTTRNPAIGENKISADIQNDASANDTVFKLNSVLDVGVQGDRGNKYIYLNVDITNTSDEDYSLSCLNNIYLSYEGNDMETSTLSTLFFARNSLNGIVVNQDPITVPANGTFSGFVTGFEIPADVDSFTVGFFPTQNEPTNKSTAIEIEITPDNIQRATDEMFK